MCLLYLLSSFYKHPPDSLKKTVLFLLNKMLQLGDDLFHLNSMNQKHKRFAVCIENMWKDARFFEKIAIFAQ